MGWSTGFMATPRLRGLLPSQRLLPALPDDKFKAELAKWREAVKANKIKPAQIIANTSTKYALTDDQKLAIEDLGVNYGE